MSTISTLWKKMGLLLRMNNGDIILVPLCFFLRSSHLKNARANAIPVLLSSLLTLLQRILWMLQDLCWFQYHFPSKHNPRATRGTLKEALRKSFIRGGHLQRGKGQTSVFSLRMLLLRFSLPFLLTHLILFEHLLVTYILKSWYTFHKYITMVYIREEHSTHAL